MAEYPFKITNQGLQYGQLMKFGIQTIPPRWFALDASNAATADIDTAPKSEIQRARTACTPVQDTTDGKFGVKVEGVITFTVQTTVGAVCLCYSPTLNSGALYARGTLSGLTIFDPDDTLTVKYYEYAEQAIE